MSTSDNGTTTHGERIREVRERHGWSRGRMGDLLGVSSATIRGYEKGSRVPRSVVLAVEFLDELAEDHPESFNAHGSSPRAVTMTQEARRERQRLVREELARGVPKTVVAARHGLSVGWVDYIRRTAAA